jgi:hypothetical protein
MVVHTACGGVTLADDGTVVASHVGKLSSEEDKAAILAALGARLDEANAVFECGDEVADVISAMYDWEAPVLYPRWLNPTMVLRECGFQNPTQKQSNRAGQVLRVLTGSEPVARGRKAQRCYPIPPLRARE